MIVVVVRFGVEVFKAVFIEFAAARLSKLFKKKKKNPLEGLD